MALFSFAAFYIADFEIFKRLQLSSLIIGIILGMIYANTLRNHLPETWVPGINFCTKEILRASIIFYGFRLTLTQLFEVGASAIVIDVVIVTSVVVIGLLVGKAMKMDRDLTILTSTGSAICGAAAVLGTEPVLKSEPHKAAVAVSTVVIFGTISMFLYPLLYRSGLFGFEGAQMGIYTGSTLHEVAHVVGAGNAMADATIANTAVITKMIRVILLAPYLIILGAVLSFRGRKNNGARRSEEPSLSAGSPAPSGGSSSLSAASPSLSGGRKITIPWFAIWFLVVIGINSLITWFSIRGGFQSTYGSVIKTINSLDTFGLTMAMTALGTQASFDKFRQAGIKPFLLALILFIWLLAGGYAINKYLPLVMGM